MNHQMDCNLLSQVKSCSDMFQHLEQMDPEKGFSYDTTQLASVKGLRYFQCYCVQIKKSVTGSLMYFLDLSLT